MLQKIDRKEMFTIPNILSFARIILAVLFFAVYQAEHGKNVIALGTILMISGVTDMLDGKIARKFNQISEFGKILDPFADKLNTNILPSMHVFVTIVCSIALLRQKDLCSHRGFKQGIWILTILIILSTLFLKQHSVMDVALALLLNCTFYLFAVSSSCALSFLFHLFNVMGWEFPHCRTHFLKSIFIGV